MRLDLLPKRREPSSVAALIRTGSYRCNDAEA